MVKFHITAFGKFQGFDVNPTSQLLKQLSSYLDEHPLEHKNDVQILSKTIIEVSAVAAMFNLCELQRKHFEAMKESNEPTVFIHFGVGGSQKNYRLESCGWNEAHFRCPDERGWTPQHQLIIPENNTLDHCMHTTLPLVPVREKLFPQYDVAISTDPGRFLCNYIYYNSLHFSTLNKTHSLFVHIPPFEVIPQEEQIKFMRAVIDAIASVLINNQ